MRKNSAFLILSLLLFPFMASANLRAPYRQSFTNGGELRSSIPLTVISNRLVFNFLHYYSGNLKTVTSKHMSMCKINATYKVKSKEPVQARFSFITPSPKHFVVTVNGQRMPVDVTSHKRKKTEAGFNKTEKKYSTYTVGFNGNLKKDINTIEVNYMQAISVAETHYGYFTSSKWYSYVNYFYWPLKEWKRDSTFKSEVIVTVPYDWSLIDKLTGPDINITLTGFDKSRKNSRKFKGTDQTEFGPQVFRAFLLKDNLPDILKVGIEEK